MQHELVPLDATVVDVYAGAHAVIFMIGMYTGEQSNQPTVTCPKSAPHCADPSKPWTLEYVVRELATCPPHVREVAPPCCSLFAYSTPLRPNSSLLPFCCPSGTTGLTGG
jgi:hypothetical protein